MPAPIDLTGHTYNRLTVLNETSPTQYPRKWVCRCECGTVKNILGASLRGGLTQSCGCLNKEILSAKGTTHGGSGTRLYSIWHNMKQRCENPNNDGYSYYGALGITVCAEWIDFASFKEWAESSGYTPQRSIDRVKGNDGYHPANCRWTTATIQARNQKQRNTNTSGHVGVSFITRLKKYEAYITVAYKKVSLGYHTELCDAIAARQLYIQQNNLNGFPSN